MSRSPNVLFLFADQVRASSLPAYGESQIATPHLDRLQREGTLATAALSTCPVCTPYRGMLLTGRLPQRTGVVVNFTALRHDETTLADVFAAAGYRTAYVGKWHLYPGVYPVIDERETVPAGRDRAGFDHWRGYNFHLNFDDPWLDGTDGRSSYRALGYEPQALAAEAEHFIDECGDRPWLCCLSSHLGHVTHLRFAPDRYYDGLPELPHPVTGGDEHAQRRTYRHYLAMIRALDEMVGRLLAHLERCGLLENTLVVFTSDHGTDAGAHGDANFWRKRSPFDTSVQVPWFMRLPGRISAGGRCTAQFTPVDILPSLGALCGIAPPADIDGIDCAPAWCGGAGGRDAALLMNFVGHVNDCVDGQEWRGLRTREHLYVRHRTGREELYHQLVDPWQQRELSAEQPDRLAALRARLDAELAAAGDGFLPGSAYARWFDTERRPLPPERRPGTLTSEPSS